MLGDRAEGATAETASHDGHGKLDHFPGRYFRLAIARVRRSGIRQAIDAIHLFHCERERRRIEPHIAPVVRLHQCACIAGVRLQMEHARGMRIHDRIVLHLLERRQAHHGFVVDFLLCSLSLLARQHQDRFFNRLGHCFCCACCCAARPGVIRVQMRIDPAGRVNAGRTGLAPVATRLPARRHHECRAAQIADGFDFLARRQPVRERNQRAFGIAEQQDVGLGIRQHGAPHGVRPVIVMRNAAQARLDAADHDIRIRVGLARALRVHHQRTIRALAARTACRVGIVRTELAFRRIAVDHRIHVAGRDAKIQARLAQLAKVLGRLPVRLADDANTIALRFQQSPDQCHAETGVIDIGIARHQYHIARIPAEHIHLGARHRQKRRGVLRARAFLRVGEKVLGMRHKIGQPCGGFIVQGG